MTAPTRLLPIEYDAYLPHCGVCELPIEYDSRLPHCAVCHQRFQRPDYILMHEGTNHGAIHIGCIPSEEDSTCPVCKIEFDRANSNLAGEWRLDGIIHGVISNLVSLAAVRTIDFFLPIPPVARIGLSALGWFYFRRDMLQKGCSFTDQRLDRIAYVACLTLASLYGCT